jgi:hypothetical protein
MDRLIQEGESRSFDGVASVDITSSDMRTIRKAAGAWRFYRISDAAVQLSGE